MGRAKKYKITFQMECTVRAENQQKAHELAEAFALGRGMSGIPRELEEPRGISVPLPECAGKWTIINIAEMGSDDP